MRSAGTLKAVPRAASGGFSALISVNKAVLSESSSLKPSERLVAIAVVDRFGRRKDGTLSAYMSVRDIAQRTGLSARTVRRALKALCESPKAVFDRVLGVDSEWGLLPIYGFTLAKRRSQVGGASA